MKIYNVTDNLNKRIQDIKKLCSEKRLDPFPVEFKMSNQNAINLLASLGGFPERYPHWKFGKDYIQQKRMDDYGLGRIYEMVINTSPSYAYLLNSNTDMETDLVIAHVYGHSDFFKNNYWFSATDRDMMETMARHRHIVEGLMKKRGREEVEIFIDKLHSLENLISTRDMFDLDKIEYNEESSELNKIQYKHEDVLGFLAKFAPVEDWQRTLINVIRDESYYFLPQRMTKIMNEGWATYWHTEIMRETLCDSSEIVNFAKVNASVLAMGQSLNPYKLGYDLFCFIKNQEDQGKFSQEYLECTDINKKANWDKKTGKGIDKIYEIRKTHNDWSFINEFLTQEFVDEYPMHFYETDQYGNRRVSQDYKKIKNQLLSQLSNAGNPIISVSDTNFNNASELLIEHSHHGTDLEDKHLHAVLSNLRSIWNRPVNLKTKRKGKDFLVAYDKGLVEKDL